MLKVLAESNYWKSFCPMKILIIFNKPIIQLLEEGMFVVQHLSNYDQFHYFHVSIAIVGILCYFRFFIFCLLFSIVIGSIFCYLSVLISSSNIIKMW